MTEYRYHTCDVFTREPFGGNPLAVVPDARGLDTEAMQRLAREFNYSETTFVLPAEQGGAREVRIVTPRVEVPFAGHPNIGTAFMLATLGEIELVDGSGTVEFEERAGLVPIRIERDRNGATFCELTAPEPLSLGPEVPVELAAAGAGLDPGDIVTDTHVPQVASVGLPFVMAEVGTRSALARADANISALRELQARDVTPDIHLYTRDAGEFDLQARMFAPLDGVPEDPATGSANGALIALLAQLDPAAGGEWHWRIAQGVEMGRPSELFGRVVGHDTRVESVHIGGYSVRVFDGSMRL